MIPHEVIIKRIFDTFFRGVEYEVEPENSLKYLYNIRLTNLIKAEYAQGFTTQFNFEGSFNVYREDDFTTTFRHFASVLSGSVLIYAHIHGRNRIIVTPEQIRNENYGLLARIQDPYKNKFDNNLNEFKGW